MKLLVLLVILVVIVLIYSMYCGTIEFLTPSPYVISWSAPAMTGGNGSNCCTYDWQVCADTACKTIIDSGTTASNVTSASTTKLDWGQTYTVQVRANNKYGPGAWSQSSLTTGNGTLSQVTIGGTVTPSGTVVWPLSAGSSIGFYTILNSGFTPGERLNGSVWATITRGSTVYTICPEGAAPPCSQIPMVSSSDGSFFVNIGTDSLPVAATMIGDIVNVDILITTSDYKTVISEITATATVSGSVPGTVTSISISYAPKNVPAKPSWYQVNAKYYNGTPITNVTGTLEDCETACESNSSCDYLRYYYDSGTCVLLENPAATGWTGFWYDSSNDFATRVDSGNRNDNVVPNGNTTATSLEDCQNKCALYNDSTGAGAVCSEGMYCTDPTTGNCGTSCVLFESTPDSNSQHSMYVKVQ